MPMKCAPRLYLYCRLLYCHLLALIPWSCTNPAFAVGYLSKAIPSSPTVIERALHANCITSFITGQSTLPCNPAALAEIQDPTFASTLFFGHGYDSAQKTLTVLQGEITSENLEEIINQNETLSSELSATVLFKKSHWGISFSPFRLVYQSKVVDKAYPQVLMYAAQEESLQFQLGTAITQKLEGGLQVRWVHRKVSYDQFAFYDYIVDSKNFLKVLEQEVLYIEPGLTYHISENWDPRFSLLLSNGGFARTKISFIDTEPDLIVGFGLTPPMPFGTLDLSLTLADEDLPELAPSEKLRVGASYSLALAKSVLTLGAHDLSLGLLTQLWSARVGIYYSWVRNATLDQSIYDSDTFFTEFGFDF